MKPREINPECIDDDAWWDIEALKLAVIDPRVYWSYVTHPANGYFTGIGGNGLSRLGFLSGTSEDFDEARVINFGDKLIAACERVSQCK